MKKRDLLWTLMTASIVMVLFHSYRAAFPLVRSLAESTNYIQGGMIAIGVFAATMIPAVLGSPRRYLMTIMAIFYILFVGQVLVDRPTVYPMLAVCFFGVLALGSALAQPEAPRGAMAAGALVLGASADAIVKLGFSTWDPIWHNTVWSTIVSLLPVAAGIGLLLAVRRQSVDGGRPDTLPGLAAAGIGGWNAIAFIDLGNAPVIATNTGFELPLASLTVFIGWTLAALALRLAPSRATLWVAALLTGAGAVALPEVHGPLAAPLAVVGLAAMSPLLALCLRGRDLEPKSDGSPAGGPTLILGIGLGYLAFTVTQFLYQFHYASNLPFWNNWVMLLPVAVLVGCAARGATRPHDDPVDVRIAALPAIGGVAVPLGLALTTPAIQATKSDTVQLVNYNIHEGVSNNGPGAPDTVLDLEAIARAIEERKPNVVLLQEIGRGWAMSGYTDEGLWFKHRLGMDFSYGKAADDEFGNGVYSSLPMTDRQTVNLGQGTGPMIRSAAGAELQTGFTDSLWVWSVHLQHNEQSGTRNDEDRLNQITTWLSQRKTNDYTIIAGDFNAEQCAKPVKVMEDKGFLNGQYDNSPFTESEFRCERQNAPYTEGNDLAKTYQGPQAKDKDPKQIEEHLDYIFTTKDLKFTKFWIQDSQASDHRPLGATIVKS